MQIPKDEDSCPGIECGDSADAMWDTGIRKGIVAEGVRLG